MHKKPIHRFRNLRQRNKKIALSRSKTGTAAIALFLCVVSLFMLLPVIYSVVQAFKPIDEIFAYPPRFFVRNPTIENFKMVMRLAGNLEIPFSRYLFNTLMVALCGTVIYVLISSMMAYPLAKGTFRGRNAVFQVIVMAIMFSGDVTAMPRYIIIAGLGMVDTYWALILPALSGTMGVFLMRQFIRAAIPNSTIEAARIDGANEFVLFFRIVMPSIKAAWLTVAIFAFQSFYNSGGGTYIYSENLKQLNAVLNSIAAAGIARMGAGAASGVIILILPVTVFLISQNSISETMAHSGLK